MSDMRPKLILMNSRTHLLYGAIALALLVGGAYFPLRDLMSRSEESGLGPVVATVQFRKNDLRIKSEQSLDWRKALTDQAIHLGDSVFSGANSTADIVLSKGGTLHMGEQSMVVFHEFENERLANLEVGRFSVDVDGSVEVVLQGVRTRLQGHQSAVEFYLEAHKKIRVRLLKGQVLTTTLGKKSTWLRSREIVDLDRLSPERGLAAEPPQIIPAEEIQNYYWRLPDLYDRQGNLFQEKLHPAPKSIQGPQTKIRALFVQGLKPDLTPKPLLGKLELTPTPGAIGYLIQESTDVTFTPATSKLFWSSETSFQFNLDSPGTRFYRARGVNQSLEISDWSPIAEMTGPPSPRAAIAEVAKPVIQRPRLSPKIIAQKNSSSAPEVVNESKPSMPDETESLPVRSVLVVEPRPSAVERRPTRGFISLGGGYDFFDFTQTISSAAPVNYSSLVGPSLSLHAGYNFGRYGLEGSYDHTPGQVKTEGTPIDNTAFALQTISLEGLYQFFNGIALGLDELTSHVRLGLQYHELPYFVINNSSLQLNQYNVADASIGIDTWYKTRAHFEYQLLFRFQQPILSQDTGGSSFRPTSLFAFDGSLGGQYVFRNRMTLGFFWFGQMQQYRYSVSESGGSVDQGNQMVFFSDTELRLGYTF